MLGELLQPGDRVIVKVGKEGRSWGYNPCPEGTVGTVLGFSEIHYSRTQSFGRDPGVYPSHFWVDVQLENKKINISSCYLVLEDKKEYEKRLKLFRTQGVPEKQKLRDLPETKFWEGDKVWDSVEHKEYVIHGIDYAYMHMKTDNGSPWPFYLISDGIQAGWYTSRREDQLSLTSRGNVWKYFHNEPLNFHNLQEEAQFFILLGHYQEIKNPEIDCYAWTQNEAVQAIKDGLAHGFLGGSSLLGWSTRVSVIRFRNEDLGRRVAEETLKGFS